jgi:hypothetical protein
MAPMAAMVVMIGPNVRLGAFGSGSGPPAQHFFINEQTNRSLKSQSVVRKPFCKGPARVF